MPKRFLGNIMTDTPTAPDGNFISSAASGVWSLAEALSYTKGGLWPSQANGPAPVGLMIGGFGDSNFDRIDAYDLTTDGNATDFGNCVEAVRAAVSYTHLTLPTKRIV